MVSAYQIEKIHITEKRVDIEYSKQVSTGRDYFTLKCTEAPLPSLPQALRELKIDILDICDLPDHYGKDLEVRGVSFTYSDGMMGVVISGVKKVPTSNSPFNINSPFLAESENPEALCLSENTVKRLRKVIEEANRYILGERAQAELFEKKQRAPGEAVPA